MGLTEKQKRFVQEYLVDLNATQAAIRAGYSEKTANRIASENLSKLDIQKEIQQAMQQQSQRTGFTQDRVLEKLGQIAFSEEEDVAKVRNQLKALELLGKHLGMFMGKPADDDEDGGTGVVMLPPVMENPGPPKEESLE